MTKVKEPNDLMVLKRLPQPKKINYTSLVESVTCSFFLFPLASGAHLIKTDIRREVKYKLF